MRTELRETITTIHKENGALKEQRQPGGDKHYESATSVSMLKRIAAEVLRYYIDSCDVSSLAWSGEVHNRPAKQSANKSLTLKPTG